MFLVLLGSMETAIVKEEGLRVEFEVGRPTVSLAPAMAETAISGRRRRRSDDDDDDDDDAIRFSENRTAAVTYPSQFHPLPHYIYISLTTLVL